MFDRVPENYDNAKDWFLYFRMTKYLPAMPKKFEAAMERVETAKAARTVMTGFASAALDIALFCHYREGPEFAPQLEAFCGLKPKHLLLLSVTDLAAPLKIGPEQLAKKLTAAGFTIDAKNIITNFEKPAGSRPASPRPGQLRNPFGP